MVTRLKKRPISKEKFGEILKTFPKDVKLGSDGGDYRVKTDSTFTAFNIF